jgi:hypothetical protein
VPMIRTTIRYHFFIYISFIAFSFLANKNYEPVLSTS